MDPDAEKTFVKDVYRLNMFTLFQKLSFYVGTAFLVIMLFGLSEVLGSGQINSPPFLLGLIIGIIFQIIALWSWTRLTKIGNSILKYLQSLETPLDILALAPKMEVRPDLVNDLLSTLIWRTRQKIPWSKSIEHQFVDGKWQIKKCIWKQA